MATSPQPDANYRPNPNRAIYLSGQIAQETLDRLTPSIVQFQGASRAPLTMFIDSPGGDLRPTDTLKRLLRATDQDSSSPCRLITVVTGTAASAAADLLSSGDYAIAYPHARILFHGVRRAAAMLTREDAAQLSQSLGTSNEGFALELASNCIRRFIFRCVVLKPEFDSIRERENSKSLSESQCMAIALEDRLSLGVRKLLRNSFNLSVEINTRDAEVSKKLMGHDFATLPPAEFEVFLLKAILDQELRLQKDKNPQWSLADNFPEIEDKFLLLVDKHGELHNLMTRLLCDRWGEFFLAPERQAELAAHEDDRVDWLFETLQERLGSIWSFFVSLCRQLQKDDYWLTAEDAYWLGLIDELVGRNDLPNQRGVSENAPRDDA